METLQANLNSLAYSKADLKVLKDLNLSDAEVAEKLGRSLRAVSSKRHHLRAQGKLAGRRDAVKSPQEAAQARAVSLSAEITSLLQNTRYPVLNTDAIRVESYVRKSFSRAHGERIVEGTPRTTITDTLRVASSPGISTKWIFTGAQNDAPIHEEFWANLKAYANRIGATIVVGPWTYETTWWNEVNPTSRSYDSRIAEYLCFGQMKIGPDFVFCGEMNTLPTASRPISDLVTYSRGRCAVFPHAKIQLKSVPSTDPEKQAHQVMTSGAVTLPKVVARKAGVKSIFHHIIGATIVEFDAQANPFCRQINAETDGSFYDLEHRVENQKIKHHAGVEAIVFGDLHLAKADRRNVEACFTAPDSLLNALKPRYAFLHDLHDHEIGNHHRKDDVHFRHELDTRKRTSVLDEVRRAGDFLAKILRVNTRLVVVDSNHDLALERFVREGRYREYGGENLRFGLEMDLAYTDYRERVAKALDAGKPTPKFSLLEWAIRRDVDLDGCVEWAYDGYSFVLGGIECGHHGFRGANGAKGSVAGFAQIGRRMSIGDKHSPEILDGVYCAGVMSLQHGYNKGPSGWAVSCIVQYPNSKRTLVTLHNGKWRP